MIRCVAIDDEPLALRQIAAYIKKVPYLELTQTFNDALKAQQWLLNNDIDLIFIDINMPDLTGTNLVRSLITPPMRLMGFQISGAISGAFSAALVCAFCAS